MKNLTIEKQEFLKGMLDKDGRINNLYFVDRSKVGLDETLVPTTIKEAPVYYRSVKGSSLSTYVYPQLYTVRVSHYEDRYTEIPSAVNYHVYTNREDAINYFFEKGNNLEKLKRLDSDTTCSRCILYAGTCEDNVNIPRPAVSCRAADCFSIMDYIYYLKEDGCVTIQKPYGSLLSK